MLRKSPSSSSSTLRQGAARARTAARTADRASRRSKRRKITADDLLRLATVASPRISPDGQRVVYAVKRVGDKHAYASNLWMADADGGPPRPFTQGDHDSAPAWSPDGQSVAFVCAREKGRPQVALIPVGGGEARVLTDFPEGTLASFRWAPDGRWLAVAFRARSEAWTKAEVEARKQDGRSDPPLVIDDPWYRYDGDGYFGADRFKLYHVDVETGAQRLLYDKDKTGSFSYDIAPDGKRIVLGTNRHRQAFAKDWHSEICLLDVKTGALRSLDGLPQGAKLAVTFSPDGQRIAWASVPGDDGTRGTHNVHLLTCDTKGGDVRDLLADEDDCLLAPTISDTGDVEFNAHYRWFPDSRRLWLQLGRRGETQLASVGARGGELEVHTKGRRQHYIGNLSTDGKRMALAVADVTHPADVHVADVPATRKGGAPGELTTRQLSAVNAELLAELDLATPTAHWVRSKDGTRVHTWVLRPKGASTRGRRPTILEIHGGPATQYGWTFFHEFQLLAAQGWNVVYSNPRGSKGYGQDVATGNTDNWGGKDWEDLEAVIEFTRNQPDVDSKRLGVMGGSFGGYMTLWAVGHTNVFKAAIADRCVSNMVSMWGASDIYIAPDSFFSGNTWDDTTSLWNQSPQQFLGKCKTPMLLIHSEGDLRCNIAESEQVHAALSLRGVPCRFVRYPRNTSHGMSRNGPPDMRLHRLGQITAWWKRWF